MEKTAFYAPLVRGAVIARIGKPCVVVPAGKSGKPDGSLVITVAANGNENENAHERETAAVIAKAVAEAEKIPSRVTVNENADGAAFSFLIGEDFAATDGLNAGEKDAWRFAPDKTSEANPHSGFTAASRAATMKNRVCLVTGGAQGFGEEIVRGLCEGGAIVFIADLNIKGAETLAEKLNSEYGKRTAIAVEANVGDEPSVAAMFEKIAGTTGGLDLCVSNAGVLRAQPILEQDIEAFKFVTGINYTGFAIITKHAGLLLRRQFLAASLSTPQRRWTSDIIQINSKSGLEGSNKNGAYAGSKFGGIGLVQSFAKELVEYGVKVNAICPGNFFDGPLWSDPEKGLFVQYLKTGKVPGAKTVADVKVFYEAKVPMGRGCEGPDVLKAIYYLVDQIYETGQALPVTGGQVMLS
ncbi:MAG: SDR family NAD(P)-dependent oxidoreductase [Spirochaetaceae bacterium]|jgi:sorbitol-6-phosphate 2-dehydrogenase|nr:SDR family NAD(P)-dependent oxidoreductase [Spirochaetaceae bacterium]